jgi:toxin ParE1/3/4
VAKFKLSNAAKEDLIRIHQYGMESFGMAQADKYFNELFEYF